MSINSFYMNSIENLRIKTLEPMAIAKRELSSFFVSPIAYIVITVFLVFNGFFFFKDFFFNNQAEMRNFFQLLPIVFSLIIPAITMRFFAEESHSGTIEILLTMPIKTYHAVLGKVLAGIFFVMIMMAPTLVYLITIILMGTPDPGPIIGAYIGVLFLASAYVSIGVLTSALTNNQIVSFILGLAICFFLWLLDKISVFLPVKISFLEYFGTDFHFRNISRGIIDSRDILYFISIVIISNIAAVKIIDNRR